MQEKVDCYIKEKEFINKMTETILYFYDGELKEAEAEMDGKSYYKIIRGQYQGCFIHKNWIIKKG